MTIQIVIKDAPNAQFESAVPLLAYVTSYTEHIVRKCGDFFV